MSLAIVHSRANIGINAIPVTVEIHISNGLPHLSIVGLPETTVKESKDRVRSALLNANFEFPAKRITVNLAPADLPKDGGRFDLPIAIGILAASGQLPTAILEEYEFAGELALSGELRSIQGALPFAMASKDIQRKLILPRSNAEEASLVTEAAIYPARHLLEVCDHLHNQQLLEMQIPTPKTKNESTALDFSDVQGQPHAKRAFEIAAAGGHSLLMTGPPGSGKTMLASRLSSILPPLTEEQALEVACLHSLSHQRANVINWYQRPFRAPHHTASSAALVGGGNPPKPGEISLAHHGVLFLDELPEFSRHVLETLREPLESGHIHISRSGKQATFPANFQLIAAMNPCPCGYLGSPSNRCTCSSEQIQRYRNKISGPLLDRIDLHIEVPALPQSILLASDQNGTSSAEIRKKVMTARECQLQRQGKINKNLNVKEIKETLFIASAAQKLLENAIEKLSLSARAYFRILRVARTIADLNQSPEIKTETLAEALLYR